LSFRAHQRWCLYSRRAAWCIYCRHGRALCITSNYWC
jgi:hypothetical protein